MYQEMLLYVARDFPGAAPVMRLRLSQIRFFYEGLRPELLESTKPK